MNLVVRFPFTYAVAAAQRALSTAMQNLAGGKHVLFTEITGGHTSPPIFRLLNVTAYNRTSGRQREKSTRRGYHLWSASRTSANHGERPDRFLSDPEASTRLPDHSERCLIDPPSIIMDTPSRTDRFGALNRTFCKQQFVIDVSQVALSTHMCWSLHQRSSDSKLSGRDQHQSLLNSQSRMRQTRSIQRLMSMAISDRQPIPQEGQWFQLVAQRPGTISLFVSTRSQPDHFNTSSFLQERNIHGGRSLTVHQRVKRRITQEAAAITAGLTIFYRVQGLRSHPDRLTSSRWSNTSWWHTCAFQAIENHTGKIGCSKGRFSDSAAAYMWPSTHASMCRPLQLGLTWQGNHPCLRDLPHKTQSQIHSRSHGFHDDGHGYHCIGRGTAITRSSLHTISQSSLSSSASENVGHGIIETHLSVELRIAEALAFDHASFH